MAEYPMNNAPPDYNTRLCILIERAKEERMAIGREVKIPGITVEPDTQDQVGRW